MQARTRRDRWLAGPLGVLAGVAAGLGCWVRAEQHCANLEGDATCAARPGGGFCDLCRAEHDGCAPRRPSPECHFAGPDPASDSTGAGEAATSHAITTTGHDDPEPATTGATPCTGDDDCVDPHAPFCSLVQGECVGCEAMPEPDAACASRDHTRPLCVGGACVQCTPASPAECDALGLVCDPEAHVCTECVEHEECAIGACELEQGRCFPADAMVLDVDAGAGVGPSSVGAAVAAVPDGGFGIIRVHALPGNAAYLGTPVIDGGRTIALVAAEGGSPSLRGAFGGNPALRVNGAETTAYLDRLVLRGTEDGRGLVVDGGTAWVDRSRIVQNEAGGVLAVAGASLTLRTSFVGGSVSNVPAVELEGATARIVYATLGAGSGAARALVCDAQADVEVRSSVLVAQTAADAIDCEGTYEHDAAELALGGTNVAVGPMSTQWFTGYGQGSFWLTAEGDATFAGIARWRDGDLRSDIDGDPRPSGHGPRDHAGADVP